MPDTSRPGGSPARAAGLAGSARTAVVWEVLSAVLAEADPDGRGLDVVDAAARVLGDHLGWGADRRDAEVAAYRGWLGHLAVPDASGTRSVSFGAGAPSKSG